VTHPRRTFLASTALAALGTTGCDDGSRIDRQLRFASLTAAEEELGRLSQAKKMLIAGEAWR
jgi:hypothetical protein